MRITLCQMKPDFDMDANAERLLKIVKSFDSNIYIFPELYLTGYMVRDDMPSRAISSNSSIIEEIAGKSKDKVIIFGFPERDRFLYNSAAVIHDGKIEVARKLHLPNFGPFEEKLYFKQGESVFVTDTKFGKIGVQICYDAFFPEVSKLQALKGADLIVNISASPVTSRAMFESIIPARAIENTTFFAYVNWAGLQRTMEFWGGSMLYSPRGKLIYKAPYFEESVQTVEIEMEELQVARTIRPTLRDTRKELCPADSP